MFNDSGYILYNTHGTSTVIACAQVAMGISILFIMLSTATLVLNTVPCLMGGPNCEKTNDSTAVDTSSPPLLSSVHSLCSSGTKSMNGSQLTAAAGAATAAAESSTNLVAAAAGVQFDDFEHPVFKIIEGVCVGEPLLYSA